MSLLRVLLALSPILLVFLLLVLRRTPADVAGLLGWLATVLVAWWIFRTPLPVVWRASLAGLIASLPIALVVATSIFQVSLMLEAGAIDRVVVLIKQIAPAHQVVQIMIINVGMGTLLTALGAVPVSILPPIMLALGYSTFTAIALPAIGYDALCTYALLGIPVVVFSSFVAHPVNEVGGYFARFMPVVSTCIAAGMVWIVGKWRLVRQGVLPILLTGFTAGGIAIVMNALKMVTLTGIGAGLGVIAVMLFYLQVTGRTLLDRSALTEGDHRAERRITLMAALSPWLILTLCSLVVNAPFLPFFEFLFTRMSMPVELIPGQPERIRLFWQAYFWILVSTLLALPFLRPTGRQIKTTLAKWVRRAPRPVLAAAVFFAMAFVINHSGKGDDWQLANQANNMVHVIANASAVVFGPLYPLVAPYLGLLGGFISGSETSSIAMLTGLHLSTAEKLGVSGLLVAASSGIGGGLASVVSPAKLQNASASIDRIGEESGVIGPVFVISLLITGVVGLLALFWA